MTSILVKGKLGHDAGTESCVKMECWRQASASSGTPQAAASYQEEAREDSPTSFRFPYPHLGFRLLTSRTGR